MKQKMCWLWIAILLAGCMVESSVVAPAQPVASLAVATAEERATAIDTPAIADTPEPTRAISNEADAALFNGIPHGVTEDGFPFLGEADAPVTLIDYSDFL